jgi:hypothetical protein
MDKSKFDDKKEWRKFGFTVAAILALLATVNWIRGHHAYPVLLAAGGGLALAAGILPLVLKPVYILFLYLGEALGWFMTRVILSILFFVILTPVSWISKLTGKKYFAMRPNNSRESYWLDIDESSDVDHYEKQY